LEIVTLAWPTPLVKLAGHRPEGRRLIGLDDILQIHENQKTAVDRLEKDRLKRRVLDRSFAGAECPGAVLPIIKAGFGMTATT